MCYNCPVPLQDYALHREFLRSALEDGLILLEGGKWVPRQFDVHYPFHQTSNFMYLAGVPEADYCLLLDPKKGLDTLFIPRVDIQHRVWLGHVPDPKEAKSLYGFERVLYADEIPGALKAARKGYRKCYADRAAWRSFGKHLRGLSNRPAALEEAFQTLRAVKTAGEIALLKRANEISAKAHLAVMAAARPGMREYELQAEFERVCLSHGLRHQGYLPIVAAGKNGAVLHYHRNNAVLREGDLLVIDAGGECEGYSADITRTFPIGGKFSSRQRDVYDIVLETQKQCIDRARPGALASDLHLHAMRVIAEGLRSLGVLKGSTDELVDTEAVRLFFPHGLGHMLGLDVHDCPGGKKRQVPAPRNVRMRFNAKLEPGFVITVEPGVYFIPALLHDAALRRKHKSRVDFSKAESFLDLGGVRIEDNVVIRALEPALDLTLVPKEPADVEAACGR